MIPLLGLLLVFSCSPSDTLEEVTTTVEHTEITDESSSSNTPKGLSFDHRSKETILAYFDELIANEQVIVGQHCGDAPTTTKDYYNNYVDVLADEAGRHVGIVGADFGWYSGSYYPVNTLIDHWNEGGLVTVSWHADNPFETGIDVYWNSVENKEKIDLKSLRKGEPQTEAWISYRTELDNVAGALQELRDAGVTVIWRPFHEMN